MATIILDGDATGAVSAAKTAATSMDGVAASVKRAAAAERDLLKASKDVDRALAEMKREADQAAAALRKIPADKIREANAS